LASLRHARPLLLAGVRGFFCTPHRATIAPSGSRSRSQRRTARPPIGGTFRHRPPRPAGPEDPQKVPAPSTLASNPALMVNQNFPAPPNAKGDSDRQELALNCNPLPIRPSNDGARSFRDLGRRAADKARQPRLRY
jgi:hypothetical protein